MQITTLNSQLSDLSAKLSEALDQLLRLNEEIEMIEDMATELFPDFPDPPN